MSNKVYFPPLDIENVLPILNKIAIFGGLNDTQLYKVFRLLQTVEYAAGEVVFRNGDDPSYIYVIKRVKIELLLEGERYGLKQAIFGIGHCFGEASVIGIQPHTATAVALDPTELIVLSREALHSIFDDDKELFGLLILNIAREVSRRLKQTDETLLHYVLGE